MNVSECVMGQVTRQSAPNDSMQYYSIKKYLKCYPSTLYYTIFIFNAFTKYAIQTLEKLKEKNLST